MTMLLSSAFKQMNQIIIKKQELDLEIYRNK